MHDSSHNPQIIWRTRLREFDLTHRGIAMGILNVTPDSFSDGGRYVNLDSALAHADAMITHGAEIIDIGGESTRPGAEPVDEHEELRRVIPIIEQLAKCDGHGGRFVISVDTMKPSVARAAMRAGASVINDIGGFRENEMAEVTKESGAGVVIMHMQGEPRTMQDAPIYADVCADVRNFFCESLCRCVASGVPATNTALDPGIGFGKTPRHNFELLQRLNQIAIGGRPLLVGVSRKSFMRTATGLSAPEDREWPTVALTCHSRERGARVFRVHDVKSNVEALRMTEAILGS